MNEPVPEPVEGSKGLGNSGKTLRQAQGPVHSLFIQFIEYTHHFANMAFAVFHHGSLGFVKL